MTEHTPPVPNTLIEPVTTDSDTFCFRSVSTNPSTADPKNVGRLCMKHALPSTEAWDPFLNP